MSGPVLYIDLNAIKRNWQNLAARSQATCAAVIKADAYGLGMQKIALALHQVGCNKFFVATLAQAAALREMCPQADIYVLHGEGPVDDFLHHRLTPVLSAQAQVEGWLQKSDVPFAVHVDTAMNRLGLTATEFEQLVQNEAFKGRLCLLISHLACADAPDHPLNTTQLARFEKICALAPGVPASLCNSSGIFLGEGYHFDLLRPGVALYGLNPTPAQANPMAPVVRLEAPILALRQVKKGETISYGAAFSAPKDMTVAVVEAGYAHGFMRSLSDKAMAAVGTHAAPAVGRITMDLSMFDVSDVPVDILAKARILTLMGGAADDADTLAAKAGTIGYEILTSLGAGCTRVYI